MAYVYCYVSVTFSSIAGINAAPMSSARTWGRDRDWLGLRLGKGFRAWDRSSVRARVMVGVRQSCILRVMIKVSVRLGFGLNLGLWLL